MKCVKFVVLSFALRAGAAGLPWTRDADITIGGPLQVIGIGAAAAFAVIVMLDSFSASEDGSLNKSAVAWLNRAGSLKRGDGQPDRKAIVLTTCLTAVGQEIFFRGAVPTVVPVAGAMEDYLPIPYPIPTGAIVSVVLYSWQHDPKLQNFAVCCGIAFAMAAHWGGVAAAVLASVLTNLGSSSLYFFAVLKKSQSDRAAKQQERKQMKKK